MTLPDVIRNNPAAWIAALRAIVLAALTFGAAFGLHVTPDQQSAILQLGGALTTVALLFSVVTITATVPSQPTAKAPVSSIQSSPK